MPNWCDCEMTIRGDGKSVQPVLDFIKGEGGEYETAFDFSKVIPYPEEYTRQDKVAQEYNRREKELRDAYQRVCPACGRELWAFDEACTNDECKTPFTVSPELIEKFTILKAEFGLKPSDYGVKDGYNQGGYDWCINNWGTKWNASDVQLVKEDDERAVINFNTAWAPPTPVVIALAAKFPEYRFGLEYYEGGMGFCGSMVVEGGEVVQDCSGDYCGSRGG